MMTRLVAIFFVMAAMTAQGCGYTTRSALKPYWKTIYIAPVQNAVDFTTINNDNLYAPLLEVKLRDGVSEGMSHGGYLEVVNSPEDADLILKVFLTYYRHDPLRYDLDDNVTEWSVGVGSRVELWDARRKRKIRTEGIGGSRDGFRSGPDAISEDAAIDYAVEDLGRRIVERIVEYW